jgi:hypothetical protein
MSEITRRRPQRKSRHNGSSEDYPIGYGKPPKKHQFRRGQSGNPRGRPKGAKNTATLLREILDRKIEVRSGSHSRKITIREVILTRFAESSLKGDVKAAAFLLQRYDGSTGDEQQTDVTTMEEEAIIAAFAAKELAKRGQKT